MWRLAPCLVVSLWLAVPSLARGQGETPPPGMTVERLAALYGLREITPLSGERVRFTGNGHTLIAAPLCPAALLDGRLVPLDPPPALVAGSLMVRGGATAALTEALVTAMVGPPPKIRDPVHETPLTPEEVQAPPSENAIRKIVLDPGHGGNFDGAKGARGLLEKTVTLDVSRRLATILRGRGIEVVMTRDTDRHLSSNLREDLKRRVDLSNHERPDCFVSIHVNYAASPAVKGYEIFTGRPDALDERARDAASWIADDTERIGSDPPDDPATRRAISYALQREFQSESRELAESIRASFRGLPTEDRGLKEAGFYVLKWAEVPAVLVELDFVSNPAVEKRLGDPSQRQEFAERLSRALEAFGRDLSLSSRKTR